MKNIVLLLVIALINTGAQISLRTGMLKIGEISFASSLSQILPRIFTNIFLLMGILGYISTVILYLIILSRVEVSFAYAFLSLSSVFIAVIGYFFLHEAVTPVRLAGILLVCIGVFLIIKSKGQ
ncbi:transporter [Spirochaetia bacterium]|nr:transporter [Spirochaetia bacterium]